MTPDAPAGGEPPAHTDWSAPTPPDAPAPFHLDAPVAAAPTESSWPEAAPFHLDAPVAPATPSESPWPDAAAPFSTPIQDPPWPQAPAGYTAPAPQPQYGWTPVAAPISGPLGVQPWTPTAPVFPPAWAGPSRDEITWATAAHWLPLLTHWVGPLVVLLTVGRRSEHVRAEAAASLNWELTVACLLALAVVLAPFGVIGPALALGVIALSVGLHVLGAVAASRGGSYVYPLALPIVR